MKIMSYIQKTIYALFLLALFSGCTDEVLDGGGNGSTTPIEEGKLVDVKFVLDKAGEETVLTKGWDSDDEPEVDELLFLQYKGENLVYAWYTDEEKDFRPPTKSGYDFEGWGTKSKVINVKLLSGKGYQVYVVANVDLDDDKNEYDEQRGDNNDRGPVNLENANIISEFGTLNKLKAWTRNNSNFLDDDDKEDNDEKKYSYPDDEDIMFGIASNESENGLANKKNYDYTKMATNFSDEYTSLNDDSKNSYLVDIEDGAYICATLYPPYSKVTLTIEKDKSFSADLTITSVKLFNRPKDYSLFSGYSLSGEGSDDRGKSLFEIETEGVSIDKLSEQPSKTIILYENMAGTVDDKMNPFGESIDLKQPGYPYTYIEVKGIYKNNDSNGNVVYRFILGKNADTDCNVERNVHYYVTMRLLNDGGVNKPSWSVNYDGKKDDNKLEVPILVSRSDFDLDAHATLNEINVTFNKPGHYYIISGDGSGGSYNLYDNLKNIQENNKIIVDGILSSDSKKIKVNWGEGPGWHDGHGGEIGRGHIEVKDVDIQQEYTLKFIQSSWFDNGGNTENPGAVSTIKPWTHKFSIVYCKEAVLKGDKTDGMIIKDNIEVVKTFTVTQYPPLVVSARGNLNEVDHSYFVERFYENDNGVKDIENLKKQLTSFNDFAYPAVGNWVKLENEYLNNFVEAKNQESLYVILNGEPWTNFLGEFSSYREFGFIADDYREGDRYRFVAPSKN